MGIEMNDHSEVNETLTYGMDFDEVGLSPANAICAPGFVDPRFQGDVDDALAADTLPDDDLDDIVAGQATEAHRRDDNVGVLVAETGQAVGAVALDGSAEKPADTAMADATEKVGAQSASGAADPEACTFSTGERAMLTARRLYRENKILRFGPIPGENRLRATYGDNYLKGKSSIDGWHAQRPDDPLAAAIVKKFMITWVKSLAVEDSLDGIEPDAISEALTVYYENAAYIRDTHGVKTDVASVAMFNTRAEIDQAFAEASEAGLAPAHIRYAIDNAKIDSLGGVREVIGRMQTVNDAISEGRVKPSVFLTKRVIINFALRSGDGEACVERVTRYVDDVRDISSIFRGNQYITRSRIQDICMRPDPEGVMAEKTRLIDELTPAYVGKGAADEQGRGAITGDEIAFCVFGSKDPRDKLEGYLRDAPALRAAVDDRLTPDALKRLYFENADPLEAARKRVVAIDNLKQALADHPHADALQDSDYAYLVKYHASDAITVGSRMATNLAISREYFANNWRVNEKILHRASVMEGDVKDNVNYALLKIRTLRHRYLGKNIPSQVLDEAAFKENPNGYINDFIDVRRTVQERYGMRVPGFIVNQICAGSADPVSRISHGLDAIDAIKQAYGHLADITDDTLVRNAMQSGNVRAAAIKVYAAAVFEEMQDCSRQKPTAGSRAHTDRSFINRTETVRELGAVWLKDMLTEGVGPEIAAEHLARLYYSYTNRPGTPDLTKEPEMLRAVAEHYGAFVGWLATEGFNNPPAVAQINNEHKMRIRIAQGEDVKMRMIDAARGYPNADVVENYGKYSSTLRLLRRHTRDQDVPKNILKHFAKRKDDPVAGIKAHLKKTEALPQIFAGVEGVDSRVIYYFRAHYYADPAQGVRDYLKRRTVLKRMTSTDSDFDDSVVRDISLQVVNPRRLSTAIAEYKQRLQAISQEVKARGRTVDADLLREAAAPKTHNVESRVERAIGRQNRREARNRQG